MKAEAFAALQQGVQAALETYSNVHRGSGHNSLVSTHLFEQAREIILETLGLDKGRYTLVFCTPRRAELLKARLKSKSYRILSSQDLGLPLGLRAIAVERKALPGGAPFQAGGGTARVVSPGWVVWSKAPDRFEAGTPAIVNVIAFARALRLLPHFGKDAFQPQDAAESVDARQRAAEILYDDDLEKYSGIELLARLRQTLIGQRVPVPTTTGSQAYINLDNGASTPTFAPVWDVVCRAWGQPEPVRQALIQEVRSICAGVLGAPPASYDAIFTSNTTEAIHLVAESLAREGMRGLKPRVLNTLLEHNSNELPWRALRGFSLLRLAVDEEGFVDLNELERLLRTCNQEAAGGEGAVKNTGRIHLVAVSGASNVLGVCNPLAEISRIVHRYGARLLVDAAQLVAHRKVDMEGWGIDYLAFSAHKAYAPFGTGVLLARKGLLRFDPAELERIRLSGEENIGGIAALGKAFLLLQRIGLELIQEEEQALTRRAMVGLAQIPGVTLYGIQSPEAPRFAHKSGVIVFRLDGLMANQVARELAEQGGIGVRYGCHCAHLLVKHLLHISPPLELFQGLIVSVFPQISLPGLTRVSLGIENSAEEVDRLIQGVDQIARQPRGETDNPFKATQTAIQKQMDDFARALARRVYQLE